jgi:hypothetical protein
MFIAIRSEKHFEPRMGRHVACRRSSMSLLAELAPLFCAVAIDRSPLTGLSLSDGRYPSVWKTGIA